MTDPPLPDAELGIVDPFPPEQESAGDTPLSRNLTVAITQELTSAIAQARTVEGAIEITLREICALTGWTLGQAWTSRRRLQSPGVQPRLVRGSERCARFGRGASR